jgi:hypothetical protein
MTWAPVLVTVLRKSGAGRRGAAQLSVDPVVASEARTCGGPPSWLAGNSGDADTILDLAGSLDKRNNAGCPLN